ncbi:DMT family transporter [Sorangium sp. So ce1128]
MSAPSARPGQRLAMPAIVAATLFWGMTFAFIKDAVSRIKVFDFLALRFSLAALTMAFLFPGLWRRLSRAAWRDGAALGVLLFGTVAFQTKGLETVPASTASFLTGFSVVLVLVLEAVVSSRRPSLRALVLALVALAGVALVSTSEGDASSAGTLMPSVGQALILGCALCFAGYVVAGDRVSQRRHDTAAVTFVQLATIAILSLMACTISGEGPSLPTQARVWGSVLFCALLASAVAFYLQLRFQGDVGPQRTAIIFSLEPVFATATAVLFLGETVSWAFAAGAALILASTSLSRREPSPA